MSLADKDIQYLKEQIPQWLASQGRSSPAVVYEIELRERQIRVEEELKHQRELMLKGFEQVDKRFEQVDKRFEQVDKRFEQVEKRFEQVDKRFEQVDKRFESMQIQMDKRFEQTDRRFTESLQHADKIAARHDRMQWLIFLTMVGYFFKEKILPVLTLAG